MISALAGIILPVLVCAGIGFAWEKSGRPFDADHVTSLIMLVGAPCLVFHTLATISVDFADVAMMAYAMLTASAVFAMLGLVILKSARWPLRPFLPALMFPNTGNMGLPLCLLAFGPSGLALGVGVFSVSSVIMFTLGPFLAAGRLSWQGLVRMPIIPAVLLGMAALAFHITLPSWIEATTRLLAGITIPMMLITLGVSIARLGWSNLRRGMQIAALRLASGFVVGTVVARLFGLEGAARGVLILQCSMPVAVFAYLFARQHREAEADVAGAVVVSTALSFATMPLLLWWVLP